MLRALSPAYTVEGLVDASTVNPGLAGACVVTCTQSLPPFTLR